MKVKLTDNSGFLSVYSIGQIVSVSPQGDCDYIYKIDGTDICMTSECYEIIPDDKSCDCGGTCGKHHMLCPESPAQDIREGRTFNSGAYRDGEDGKLDYSRALCPNVLERYLEFLAKNRKQSNGDMRDFDNWKRGIPVKSYLSSMMRHTWTVWKYFVGFKKPKTETGDIVDELCAIMFNVMGLIHVLLKAREKRERRKTIKK